MSRSLLDRRWPWLAAAAVIVLLFLSQFVQIRFGAVPERPAGTIDDILALRHQSNVNILFILVDMLRADRLGCYGYKRNTSPEIDRVAASGVRFAHQLSQSSWTKASMASLWTGMYPVRTGITRFDDVIPDQARMPAEILKDAGFFTAGIWRNGWVSNKFGFSQGFDSYVRPGPTPIPPNLRIDNPTLSSRSTDEDVLLTATEFLRVHRDDRWMLYLHLMDLHEYVYDESTALFGGSYSDIYDNSVRRVDGVIGSVLANLAEMGLSDRTIVVIAADHGEAFRERGFEGHAREVYRETTEVPLIISFPFRLEPGAVIEARTRNVDIWPTLLDLVGAPPLPHPDGHSLVPHLEAALRGDPPPKAVTAVAYLDQTWGKSDAKPSPTVAVVDGPLRYVRVPGPHGPEEHLFDASRDPKELEDRARADPESLARLSSLADAYLKERPPWGKAPKRDLNELELNQLRALGYAVP